MTQKRKKIQHETKSRTKFCKNRVLTLLSKPEELAEDKKRHGISTQVNEVNMLRIVKMRCGGATLI